MRFRRQPSAPPAAQGPAHPSEPAVTAPESPSAVFHAELAAALTVSPPPRPPAEVPAHILLALDDAREQWSPVVAAVRGLAGLVLLGALIWGVAAVTGAGPSPLALIGL